MKYLMYQDKVFRQLSDGEDFVCLTSPNLHFNVDMTLASGVFPETYLGTLYAEGVQHIAREDATDLYLHTQDIIHKDMQLYIVDDPRDLITKDNVYDWLIIVCQRNGQWYARDVYYVEAFDDSISYYQSGYFAINLASTPADNGYERGYDLDINSFSRYKLYHIEDDGNYLLIRSTESN